MVNIKVSRILKIDPQKIWALINRVERFPEWLPGVVSAQMADQKNKQSGFGREQLLKTRTEFGVVESLQKVIVWDPPNKITWEHLRDVVNGQKFTYAREIKTTFSITNMDGEITLRIVGSWIPSGISGRLMNRVMEKAVTKQFSKALENLENILEEADETNS